jgi:hypothetical protein
MRPSAAFLLFATLLPAQQSAPPRVGNVFPHLTVRAPGAGSRSEAGIGALIPWADRLWMVGYVAHVRGEGLGLYEIGDDLAMRRHAASVTGTFANRFVHWSSAQVFLGPHAIDAQGNVRTIEALRQHRLTATCAHLKTPDDRVCFLTMEGLLFEVDVKSLAATQLFDLVKELSLDRDQAHFKGAHTAQGRIVVANNTYEEDEFLGRRNGGRLAEWNGQRWTIVEKEPFVEVAGKQNATAGARFGNTLFALGWDRGSVLLRVLHDGRWTRYRLPKGSQSFDHTWNTEWMRIREAQTERYLMDAFGLFYELPALVYGDRLWGIKPICSHMRIVTDFCHWNGLFVMAGDQTDNAVGQPQSGLWLGNLDELASFAKPTGWGGPWWDTRVAEDEASDPFLMTGFDRKALHVAHDADCEVVFTIEVDFRGDGSWRVLDRVPVAPKGYAPYVFPPGFSAHWVRLRASHECTATAHFHYT